MFFGAKSHGTRELWEQVDLGLGVRLGLRVRLWLRIGSGSQLGSGFGSVWLVRRRGAGHTWCRALVGVKVWVRS